MLQLVEGREALAGLGEDGVQQRRFRQRGHGGEVVQVQLLGEFVPAEDYRGLQNDKIRNKA